MAGVPPDISYFIDSAAELMHIAPDTANFLYKDGARTTEFIDNLDACTSPRLTGGRKRRHLDWLQQAGLVLEDRYLHWRYEADRMEASRLSLSTPELIKDHAREFVLSRTEALLRRPCGSLSFDRLRRQDREYFAQSEQIMRRCIRRVLSDLSDFTDDDLRRELYNVAIERHRQRIMDQRLLETARSQVRGRSVSLRELKAKDRKWKAMVKRSVRFAERLMGHEPVRVFLSRGDITIHGKLATYVVVKGGSVGHLGHGNSKVVVLENGSNLHLCDICIYTADVPLLDHVASILMHVQAGHEEEILTRGNLYNVSPAISRNPWIKQFLPQRMRGEIEHGLLAERVVSRQPVETQPEGYAEARNLAIGRWNELTSDLLRLADRIERNRPMLDPAALPRPQVTFPEDEEEYRDASAPAWTDGLTQNGIEILRMLDPRRTDLPRLEFAEP